MTAAAKGRTLYELSGKAWLGLGLVPWEEIRPEDKETFGAIEDALLAPLRDANAALTARVTELEQQLATLQPEGVDS